MDTEINYSAIILHGAALIAGVGALYNIAYNILHGFEDSENFETEEIERRRNSELENKTS